MLAGACPLGNIKPAPDVVSWSPQNVLQGGISLANMPELPVPMSAKQWVPYWGTASQIGPMAIQGGIVSMVQIGPTAPVNPIIDPDQRFASLGLPLDATGALAFDGIMLGGYAEPQPSMVLGAESPMAMPAPLNIARTEILNSGLLKTLTIPNMPVDFGLKIYDTTQSSMVFEMTGTTVDGTGTPIPNCRVIAYQSGWRMVQDMPVIIAETVSDGAGNFSMLLRNIDYQLTAYKEGSPDKAGITRQNVTPISATTIYLRDPTTPDGPGGSAAYRPIGSPIVRRLQ